MEKQKINLDIRTILSQLEINFERYTAWEKIKQVDMWEDNEWLDCLEKSNLEVAAQR